MLISFFISYYFNEGKEIDFACFNPLRFSLFKGILSLFL